ncbi:MAG: FtsX-like permease family protein [Methylococcaceae bacterium]|nr:FtsX-like permease family protein [Methylococcaceae bacterium]MDZ4155400.1 FtsX-like permease family protein [Methylococcales bacterium]MDP2392952.1 FtsX-like permease family protein [Methylococcaceae bacterium]MDP3018286.1 FtsX-like permease family protein [Methylococcaceae bacterium]MDP3391600.1 FtsX-like permease family protein [Methylococcaceae bacterium]
MNHLWHKVFADLTAHKARSLLSVSSLTIGILIIGMLLGMIDLQLSHLDAAHRQSQPSHISLILKTDADLTVANHIKTLADVAGVDVLTQFTARYKIPNNPDWQTGTLVLRPDYQRQQYDQMTLLSGHWPQGQHLAAERLTGIAAKLKTEDKIEFETATGLVKFDVDGIIRHPFVKPPTFGGQLHFFIDAGSAAVFGIKPHSFRQVLVQVSEPYSEAKARLVAGSIRSYLSQSGIGVNATLLQDPEKHWGRAFFSGINLILMVMAWASLALSSVLILNTVTALITQQTDQIGIMKSIGASRWTIAKIYLAEVLILALLALMLAMPISLAGAFFSSRWLLDLFNVEMPGFACSYRTITVMCVGGLLAPLLASFWPIWRGASMSVRQAIASYGLGSDFASDRFDMWLERRLSIALPTLYAVALGNLFRRKARLFWTQCVLIITGVLFMVILSLIASVNLTLDNELARSRYAVRLGFSVDQPTFLIKDVLNASPQTTALEFWQRLPAELQYNGDLLKQSGSLGAQLIALPETTHMYQPLINEGRWLNNNDYQQKNLVLNAATAELNNIHVGDRITVKLFTPPQNTAHPELVEGLVSTSSTRTELDAGLTTTDQSQDWQVIGLYRWFVGSTYTVEPVYAPLSTIENLTQRNQVSSFALLSANISSITEEKQYTDSLKQLFQDRHIPLDVYTTVAKLEQRQFSLNQFKPVTSMLLGLASLIASVGAIGLAGTLAISVLQRTREISVCRALGASSKTIFSLFLLEGVFHGLLAWSISIPIAYAVAEPLAHKLGEIMLGLQLDFRFSVASVWLWLALVLLLSVLASYWPARYATKINVHAGLGH